MILHLLVQRVALVTCTFELTCTTRSAQATTVRTVYTFSGECGHYASCRQLTQPYGQCTAADLWALDAVWCRTGHCV
jgi:hypothetical protein